MARPLWSGSISFGLLNIPVSLVSAKEGDSISFSLLDKRDFSRIGYKQYNKKTGKDVPKREIVKGFEYEPEHFVVMTDKDFERANPKATRTIEIADFVKIDELDPLLFEKPYYLLPAKNGEKGYMLLEKVLQRSKRVAIGQIVLHRKQRLVSIMPRGKYLVCEVLRYPREVMDVGEFKELSEKVKSIPVSKRELEMAEKLVEGMTADWDPDKYKDTYYDDVMKRIRAKVRSGGSVESDEPEEAAPKPSGVLDLMPLLKKSLAERGGGHSKPARKKKTRKARSS
jgi:DNA end-binding protein Ku